MGKISIGIKIMQGIFSFGIIPMIKAISKRRRIKRAEQAYIEKQITKAAYLLIIKKIEEEYK